MNLTKYIFCLLTLHIFGVMGGMVLEFPLSNEKHFNSEINIPSDHHLPVAMAIEYNRTGQLNFLSEFEPETTNTPYNEEISNRRIPVDLSKPHPSSALRVVPSLDSLTIIYPFHSFP